MKCPNCDHEIDVEVERCPVCGALMSADRPRSPQQDAPVMPQQQFDPQPLPPQYSQPMPQQYGQQYAQPMPQPYVPQGGVYPYQFSPKQRVAYILLAVFLGWLGIHNFYAGYNGRGLAQLLISVLTFFTFSFVSWIWAIVEACTIMYDATNRPMI